MLENNEIKEILQHFPPVELAFAYGSGVFVQKGYDYSSLSSSSSSFPLKEKNQKTSLPMVDFIFVVENSELWHKENLSRNPAHYSSILSFSAKHIAAFQDRIPSHFWFNAYVPLPVKGGEGRLMKYGIINKSNALKDLFTWNNLYLAGRLHKPVHLLSSSLSSEIEEAIVANHHHAVNTSLLMLPDEFTDLELFLTVASLSYTGDIRMAVGAENPKKVRSLLLLFLFSFISLIFCPSYLLLLSLILLAVFFLFCFVWCVS
jgi:translocator assembly and maintenance protein 41